MKPKMDMLRMDKPSVDFDFVLDTLGGMFNIQEEDMHKLSRAVELEVFKY